MFPEQIIIVGVLVNLLCSFWYIKNVLKGDTKPNPVSWFIWSLAPFVGVFLQLKAGASWSVMSVFMAGFAPLLVVIFTLFKKNAFWKIQLLDIICGIFSVLALVIYIITSNLWISIIFAIASDFLAYIPTFIKTWNNPETETSSVYLGGIINNFISLLIIKNWAFVIYSFPIYLILANIVEILFIYRKKIIS
ncbi:MAG: hypothetical protein WC870_02465 [Candidatus Paceibacterota bacterium]